MRLPNERANAALQLVCQIDIHARQRVRFFLFVMSSEVETSLFLI